MAEGKDAGGKAADIYVGVVDLFSIILPGSLLVLVICAVFQINSSILVGGVEFTKFIPDWMLFLIGSYILGHFVSALGSWVMNYIYNGYFKHRIEFRKQLEVPSLRRRADHLFMEALGPKFYKEEDNRLTWGESFLVLSNAAGIAKLDRQEADSKFFRSLAAVLILTELIWFSPLTSWVPLPRYLFWAPPGILILAFAIYFFQRKPAGRRSVDQRVKERLIRLEGGPLTALDQPRNRLDWRDETWLEVEKEEREKDIKSNRLKTFIPPIAWLAYVAVMAWLAQDYRAWMVGISCWALTIMSAWRFMDLRAKRLAQGYYLTIALSKATAFGDPAATP